MCVRKAQNTPTNLVPVWVKDLEVDSSEPPSLHHTTRSERRAREFFIRLRVMMERDYVLR